MTHRHPLPVTLSVLAGLLTLVSFAADAAGDPAKGAQLVTTCMGCHGIEGYRNAYPSYRVPKLGGQKPEYIVTALQEYRTKARAHPTMQAQAASLSDEDMSDIAAFLESQGGLQTGEPASTGGAAAARGKEKAAVCAACHGATGTSTGPTWPNLAGQYQDYIEHAVAAYQAKQRQNPIMQGQAMSLSEQDIKDIAAFYSSQPGLFTARYK